MRSKIQDRIHVDPGTGVVFEVFESLDDLPEGSEDLFAGTSNFSLSLEWFRNIIENGLMSDSKALFGVLRDKNSIFGIIPLSCDPRSTLGSLTNCYSCVYIPLIKTSATVDNTSWLLGRAFGMYCS